MHGTYHYPQQNDGQYYLPTTSLRDGKTNSKNTRPCTLFLPPANLGQGNICLQACVCPQGGGCLVETPGTATAAGGTYPTVMHSCNWI